MYKDKQSRSAIENAIVMIVLIIAIIFLLDVIFFKIINIYPPKGMSVSCEADNSVVYSDKEVRKYKGELIWDDVDIRYYSCLDVDKIVQDRGDQIIDILKNEIIERAGAVCQDDNIDGLREQLNTYEYYNYCLLEAYGERKKSEEQSGTGNQ